MTIHEQKEAGYITLKEASERFGYAPDYIGQLIRKGKIQGRQVYANVAWMTTAEALEEYIAVEKGAGKTEVSKPGSLERAMTFFLSPEGSRIIVWLLRLGLALLVVALIFVFYFLSIAIDHKLEQNAQKHLVERMMKSEKVVAVSKNTSQYVTYER